MDRWQEDLALRRTDQERLEKALADTLQTRDKVADLQEGQAVKLPLSSKAFLLGNVVEPNQLHVKLGATILPCTSRTKP